jgi:hypothetical protein
MNKQYVAAKALDFTAYISGMVALAAVAPLALSGVLVGACAWYAGVDQLAIKASKICGDYLATASAQK